MTYIAYNDSFQNSFSLSAEAIIWLSERGNKLAFEILEKTANETIEGMSIDSDIIGLHRHSPILILCVKELGSDVVSNTGSLIRLKKISGNKYIIRKHGGTEIVLEPKDIVWVEVS